MSLRPHTASVSPAGGFERKGTCLGASLVLTLLIAILVAVAPAAAIETVSTFAADCTTPRTVFQLGDTVCAKVENVDVGDLNNIFLQWVAPDNTVAFGSAATTLITSNGQTLSQALPTTGAHAQQGRWRARTANAADSSVRGPFAAFRVPRMSVIGVRREAPGSVFFFRNSNTTGIAEATIPFGLPGDVGLMGDWDGDGVFTPGVYRPTDGMFYLSNSPVGATADLAFQFGPLGGTPLAGDWDGDGITTIGIHKDDVFHLRNSNSAGAADLTFTYGLVGDQAVVGDWDGLGTTTVGVYRNGVFYLRNTNSAGVADLEFGYGLAGDTPIAGDWNSDGVTTVGVHRSNPGESAFYLRNSNDAGVADLTVPFGVPNDQPAVHVANQAPVATAGSALGYTEAQAATAIDGTATVTDMDSAVLVGATAQITTNCASGEDVLSFANQNGISGVYTAGTCLMTLGGRSSVANYQTALRDVKYNNTSNAPSTAQRTVSWQVNDGAVVNNLSAAGVTSTINVTSNNSVPQVTAGGGFTYTEGDLATVIDNGITVSDADSPNLQSATAQITTNCMNTQDVLSFANTATINGVYTAATCLMTLTGADTVANYQAALRSVMYNDTSNAPSTAQRTVTWQVNDGTDNSNTPTSTISVVSVNSVPQVTAGGGFTYTEGDLATVIDNGITVSDADSPNLQSATAQITTNCLNAQDVLSFANTATINGVYTAATCLMTLTGADTVANYQAALRNVKYRNTSENPSTLARTVTWQVNDGTDNSNTPTSTVNVAAVNDAPTGATDKAATATGNVSIAKPAGHLTDGASDVEGNNPLTARHPVGLNAATATTQGGSVTINTDGSYSYNPPAGFEGDDTFSFEICDVLGACSEPNNTVTVTVSNMIWFINNAAASCTARANGCGRLSNPYSTLAAFNAENNGGAGGLNPAAGDNIFIYESVADYAGPLVLLNNQRVIGQDASQGLTTILGFTPPAGSAELPATNSANGTFARITGGTVAVTCPTNPCGIVLGQTNTLRGFTLGNVTSTGTALSGTNFGTLTLASGSGGQTADLTINTNGRALNLDTGTIASLFASITSSGGTNNISLTGVATSGTTDLGNQPLSGATDTAFNVSGGTGSFTYSGNITKSSGTGALVSVSNGHSGTLTFQTGTLSASAGTGLQFNNADGTYNFNGTNTLNGGDAGIDILNGSGGTFTFNSNTTITSPSGAAFNVGTSPGNPTVTYSGTITQNTAGQRVVNIDGTTGNAVTFQTGTVTGGQNSTGININNANGNVTFANGITLGTSGARMANQAATITGGTGTYSLGVVSIFTNNASGLVATNADGTLSTTSGTVDSSNATAINIDGPAGLTTLGMTLTRVDSAGGTANGISLQDTSGSFTVNGDGSNTSKGGNGSGGTISNKSGADLSTTTGIGIFLNNVSNVVLRRMTINGTNQNYGIRGLVVNNFTLEYSTVSGTNGTDVGDDEGAVSFGSRTGANGLTGTGTITKSVFSGGVEDNFSVFNSSGVLTMTMDDIESSGAGNDGVVVQARTTATVSVDVKNSELSANVGDHFNGTGDDAANVTFNFGNNGANTLTGGAPGALGQSVTIQTGVAWSGTGSANVSNNSINNAIDTPINLNIGGTGTFTATVNANTIGTSGVANSGTTGNKDAIRIVANGDASVDATPNGGTFTAAVTNNTIQQVSGNGIFVIARDGGTAGDPIVLNVTITGNTLREPALGNNAIRLESGATSTDDVRLHADIGGAGAAANNIQGDWGAAIGADEIRLRHQFSDDCQFILRDLGANTSNTATVATYLAGRNTLNGGTASATIADTDPTGGPLGVYETGGAPPLP